MPPRKLASGAAHGLLLKAVIYRVVATVTELGFFYVWFHSWSMTAILAGPVIVLNFIRIGGYATFEWVWDRLSPRLLRERE